MSNALSKIYRSVLLDRSSISVTIAKSPVCLYRVHIAPLPEQFSISGLAILTSTILIGDVEEHFKLAAERL